MHRGIYTLFQHRVNAHIRLCGLLVRGTGIRICDSVVRVHFQGRRVFGMCLSRSE